MPKQQGRNRGGRGGGGGNKPYQKEGQRPNELYITGLTNKVTRDILRKGFADAGAVTFALTLKGGKGLVAYENKKDAQWAVKNYNNVRGIFPLSLSPKHEYP